MDHDRSRFLRSWVSFLFFFVFCGGCTSARGSMNRVAPRDFTKSICFSPGFRCTHLGHSKTCSLSPKERERRDGKASRPGNSTGSYIEAGRRKKANGSREIALAQDEPHCVRTIAKRKERAGRNLRPVHPVQDKREVVNRAKKTLRPGRRGTHNRRKNEDADASAEKESGSPAGSTTAAPSGQTIRHREKPN